MAGLESRDTRRDGHRNEAVWHERQALAATLPPLPGARTEARAVAERFHKATPARVARVLLDAEATEASLHAFLPAARILHLASHHVLQSSRSFLVLAPATSADPHQDGFLDLDDLLRPQRPRCEALELVVLSACSSQAGRIYLGEGIPGLPMAFHCAGAPAVIASVWPVPDRDTPQLMAQFYRRLPGTAPQGKLREFWTALQEHRRQHPEPAAWAPFVFLGDPR